MVQIKVKGINDNYHVYASYDDADAFFEELKERLRLCQDANVGRFEAFFHVTLHNENEAMRLFQVCEECATIPLGINDANIKKPIEVKEYDLRGGHTYHFDTPILLLGNIHSSCYVSSEESLYVMGSVQGSVDLLHEDSFLCASSIHANVRICDSSFQNVTFFSPCKVYYEQRKIKIEKYKEELQWEKL